MNRLKKILIIYTGGTIGMDYVDGMLQVVPGLFCKQLGKLATDMLVSFELIEYENLIDSSDITVFHWQKIIDDIKVHYDQFDGFIVVHGTDTMAYTASVLSFALQGLAKPVILTGAQLPLIHMRSDGWSNLVDAFYAASQSGFHEVAIAFNHLLLRGCRAQKISTNKFFGFDSVDEEPLATFGINIEWHKKRWLKKTGNFEFNPINLKSKRVIDFTLRPGFTTEFIADILFNNIFDGIVLQTYGSGNFPLHNEKLIAGLKVAQDNGAVIVNVTQVIEGRVTNDYANSRLDGVSVISGCDMTPEAAIAKLNVLLSMEISKSDIAKLVHTNLVGELTE